VKLSDADISICLALVAAAQGFDLGAATVLAVAGAFLLGRLSR
jgi:hypothetical protein